MEFNPGIDIEDDINISLIRNERRLTLKKTKLIGNSKKNVEKKLYKTISNLNSKFFGQGYNKEILNGTQTNENYVMLEYIKHNRDVNGFVFVPIIDTESATRRSIGIDYIYMGRIRISRNGFKNLLFWCHTHINDYRKRYKEVSRIIKEFEQDQIEKNWVIDYYVLFDAEEINKPFYSFSSRSRQQTVEISMYFLNDNSIEFLNYQNLDTLISSWMDESRERFQFTRSWLLDNINGDDADRIIMYGSTVLHSYGWVGINDCDLLIVPVHHDYEYDDELQEKIFQTIDEKGVIEIKYIGSKTWNFLWSEENLDLYKKIGVNKFQDLVSNPKYYFYFQGVRLMHLDFEIISRFKRFSKTNKISDQADIIMIDTLYQDLTYYRIERKFIPRLVYTGRIPEGPELSYKLIHIKTLNNKSEKENKMTVTRQKDLLDVINVHFPPKIVDKLNDTDVMDYIKNFEIY